MKEICKNIIQWHSSSILKGMVIFINTYQHIMHACLCAQSYQTLCYPHGLEPIRLLSPWDSPGKDTGVGCHFHIQGIFPTQGSNPHLLCLLHWQVGSLPLVPPGKPPVQLHSRWLKSEHLRERPESVIFTAHWLTAKIPGVASEWSAAWPLPGVC